MRSVSVGWLRCGALLAASSLAGCLTPSVYSAPRTAPPGRFNALLVPQALKGGAEPPTAGLVVGLRAGLARRLDLGARTTLGSIAADLKWNVLRTERFDLALDAGAEALPDTFYAHVPLLLGLNLSEQVTLLPNTGVTLGWGKEPNFDDVDQSIDADPVIHDSIAAPPHPSAGPLFWRLGFGAQLRFSRGFAVQPEGVYLRLHDRHSSTRDIFSAGIGLLWGPQPY